RWSALAWVDCRLLIALPTMSPKPLVPSAPLTEAGLEAAGETPNAPLSALAEPMGAMATSFLLPQGEGLLVRVFGPVHDGEVRLVAPLGTDHLGHLVAEVDLGVPGRDGGDMHARADAAALAVVVGLGLDQLLLERRGAGREGVVGVGVGDVVGHRVHPGAVHAEAAAGRVDCAEDHCQPPIAVRSSWNLAFMAS